MRRIDPPGFDDHAAFAALANNASVGSHPQLLPHVAAISAGYVQYVGVGGDPTAVAPVLLPEEVGRLIRKHYGQPSADIAYIDEIRRMGGAEPCPMCGSLSGGTLDHVLPQTSHPEFAIFGPNLVPACKCNVLRGTALIGPNPGERILHPYFDDVLRQRVLAARFEDPGPAPRISLRLLLNPGHPQYAAVRFHVEKIVKRTQVADHLHRSWVKLVGGPKRHITEFRENPPTRAALVQILQHELERRDEFYDGFNNWESVLMTALLEDHIVDWLFERFSQPGRSPGGPLLD